MAAGSSSVDKELMLQHDVVILCGGPLSAFAAEVLKVGASVNTHLSLHDSDADCGDLWWCSRPLIPILVSCEDAEYTHGP
jgi:hypothetical protein